jgi:thioredoxin-like negative regulator of GroEL
MLEEDHIHRHPKQGPAQHREPRAGATGDLERRQDDLAHWRRVALAASEQGENAHALRCWQRVLRLQPEAHDAAFHIACCQALGDQREHAAETFAVLAADPGVNEDLRRRSVRLARLLGYGAL